MFKCCTYSEINERSHSCCEKGDRLEPHVLLHCSLGYWHALHTAVHIRMQRRELEVISMLADVGRDSQSDSLQFIGKLWFESAVSVWCMDVRYREHEFKSQAERVACKWTTSSRVKVTQNRASYKMLQKAGRREGWGEKMTKSSVCVLTAFQVIYTEWKKEKNCVDFMSLLGENY